MCIRWNLSCRAGKLNGSGDWSLKPIYGRSNLDKAIWNVKPLYKTSTRISKQSLVLLGVSFSHVADVVAAVKDHTDIHLLVAVMWHPPTQPVSQCHNLIMVFASFRLCVCVRAWIWCELCVFIFASFSVTGRDGVCDIAVGTIMVRQFKCLFGHVVRNKWHTIEYKSSSNNMHDNHKPHRSVARRDWCKNNMQAQQIIQFNFENTNNILCVYWFGSAWSGLFVIISIVVAIVVFGGKIWGNCIAAVLCSLRKKNSIHFFQ